MSDCIGWQQGRANGARQVMQYRLQLSDSMCGESRCSTIVEGRRGRVFNKYSRLVQGPQVFRTICCELRLSIFAIARSLGVYRFAANCSSAIALDLCFVLPP